MINSQGAQAEGDDLLPWDEMFDRPADELVIEVEQGTWKIKKAEGELEKGTLKIKESGLSIEGKEFSLKDIKEICLTSREFIVPREAMISIPFEIIQVHKNAKICIDTTFINGMPFLATISKGNF